MYMHLFIEKSGDLVGCYWYLSDWQTLKNRAMQWCYIVTIWHDSWYVYVVWFHPNGLFQCSKSLFKFWTIVVDNSGNQPSICRSPRDLVPFSPTNVVRLRVIHDFCLFGNAGNDDEQWVEAMALSYQRCITRCPRAVSWVIPRTEVWLWPSSYKALLICAGF